MYVLERFCPGKPGTQKTSDSMATGALMESEVS